VDSAVPFLLSVLALAAGCAAVWSVLAHWLKVQPPQRGCLATFVPVFACAALLWADGGMFNGVVAIFLLPLATFLCIALVLRLER
jgi:hypothetical protein